MKKFLSLTVLFTAILLLIAATADHLVTRKLHTLKTSPFANWNDIYQHNIQSDVLIMGSSRAYVQFNPAILDSILHINSYNLGSNGRRVDSQILKYRIYRQHNPKPKLILYEVHEGTMGISNNFDQIQFLPYLRDDDLWLGVHEQEGFRWDDRWIPCWRYRNYAKTVRDICKNKSQYTDNNRFCYKGFCDFDKKWNGTDYNKISTIRHQCDSQALALFDAFLADCQRENVRVVMVMAPYYIGATNKLADEAAMKKMFLQFAERYNVPLLDYTHTPICSDTTYFYNASHLNRYGSQLFTKQLAHDLDSLGLVAH